ncbi:MAG: phosphate ABC transporter permease subunit PstC, partial [SAR202 cluster bacterium]|nr:phosphate ABC transporter permease subunit PstC [SAR202 cluster bacterium]
MSTNTELESNQAILDRVTSRRHRQHVEQAIVAWLLRVAALISILTTIGIVIILVAQSAGFFAEVSPWDFLTGTEWTPLLKPQQFGVLSLVGGTLLVAAIAGIVSLTLGLGAAIFLSEYAPE